MSWHVLAWGAVQGPGVDADVPLISDQIIARQNNHAILPKPMQLLGAQALGASLTRAKIVSPTLRQIASPFIRPPIIGATQPANPNFMMLDHMHVTLPAAEEVQALITDTVGTTEGQYLLAYLSDQIVPVNPGPVIPLRFTGTTAAVANVWSDEPIVFADSIPAGRYVAVLSELQHTTPLAHRWIFDQQYLRPGFPSQPTLGSRLPNWMMRYPWGTMGEFNSNSLPRLQVLAGAADAAYEGYLWVYRKGGTLA